MKCVVRYKEKIPYSDIHQFYELDCDNIEFEYDDTTCNLRDILNLMGILELRIKALEDKTQ